MDKSKNFVVRVFDAVLAGREREAQRYLDRFEREYGKLNGKLTKR